MANPMQKRSKNAFLLGVIITLVLTLLISGILMTRINNLNKNIKAMESKQSMVCVAAVDIKSGDVLTQESLIMQTVITTVNGEEIVDDILSKLPLSNPNDNLDEIEENLNEIGDTTGYSEEEEEPDVEEYIDEELMPVTYIAKIDIPAGSIITQSMITIKGETTTKDQRIQEYNMISLPSQLFDGSFIDVRFRLPSGEDYVVLSKKKVEQSNSTTIWLKVDESEILTMNNAIIEYWMMKGSKLYAIEYIEPGMQDEAVQTYPISRETLDYINSNPNVLNEARAALAQRYTEGLQAQRNDKINSILNQYIEDRDDLVDTGTKTEVGNIQEAREEYIESLGLE